MTLYDSLSFLIFPDESCIQQVNFKSLKIMFFIDLNI